MAARVNIRFLLILFILVALVAGGVGAVLLFQKQTAADHIAKAQELIDAGSLKAAQRQLRQAIGKEPRNEDALARYQSLLQRIVPSSQTEADELSRETVSLRTHRAVFFPEEFAAQRRAIIACRAAMMQSSTGEALLWWDEANNAAERLLAMDGDEEARVLGTVTRARWLATEARGVILRADRTDEQRAEGIRMLEELLEDHPADDRVLAALVDARRGDLAVQIESEAGPRPRQEALDRLIETLERVETAIEADRDEAPIRTATAIAMGWRVVAIEADEARTDARVRGAGFEEASAAYRAALDRFKRATERLCMTAERWAGEVAIDDMDPSAVPGEEYLRVIADAMQPVSILAVIDERYSAVGVAERMRTREEVAGTARAVAIDVGIVAADARRVDVDADADERLDRIAAFEAVIDRGLALPPQPAGIDGRMQRFLERRLRVLDVEAGLLGMEVTGDEMVGELRERLAALEAVVRDLGEEPAEAVDVLYARGLVGYAAGDTTATASLFERVLEQDSQRLDTFQRGVALRLLGRTLEQEGALARAAEVYEQSVAAFGFDPQILARLARARISLGQLDQAVEQIRRLEEVLEPGSELLDRLNRAIAVARGESTDDPIAAAFAEIRRLEESGRMDEAMAAADRLAGSPPGEAIAEVHARVGDLAFRAGDTERARAAFARAVELSPGTPRYEARLAAVSTDDPVQRAIEIAEAAIEDPTERAVRLADQFEAELLVVRRQLQNGLEGPERAAAEAEAAGFEAALAEQLAVAEAGMQGRPPADAVTLWMARLLRNAAAADDFTTAEAFLTRVRAEDLDRAGGAFAEGQLMLARSVVAEGEARTGFLEQAVAALGDAGRLLPFSASVARLRGEACRQLGRIDEAVAAFAVAYDNAPSDPEVARLYCDALVASGQPLVALEVAKAVTSRRPDDRDLREFRLNLELEAGNQDLVLLERRKIHARQPGDLSNSVRYAYLLIDTLPSYPLLVDAQGQPTVMAGEWARMGPERQRQRLAAERRAWIDEARTIIESTAERLADGDSAMGLGLDVLRALASEASGNAEAAVRLLVDAVARAQDPEVRSAAVAASTALLVRFRRPQDAINLLQAEQARVAGVDPAIEWMLAMMLREINRPDLATVPLQRAREAAAGEPFIASVPRLAQLRVDSVSVAPVAVARDLVRSLLVVGDVQAARRIWDESPESGAREDRFIDLAIIAREADAARLAEDEVTAAEREARFEEVLSSLIQEQPTDPQAWGLRINRLVMRSRLEGRAELLEEADRVLEDARTAVRDAAALEPAILLVLEARGNDEALASQLVGIVEDRPDDESARGRLVDVYQRLGRMQDAERIIREAVNRLGDSERSIPWRRRLGEVLAAREAFAEAAGVYAEALRITGGGDAGLLRLQLQAMLSGSQPAARAAAELLAAREANMARDPGLRAIYGRSLLMIGRDAPAMEQFARSLADLQAAIAEGRVRPTDTAVWTQQVVAGVEGDPAEAENRIRAIAGPSEDWDPWMLMAVAQAWTGRGTPGLERAAEVLGTAITRLPDSPEAAGARSLLRRQLGGVLVSLDRAEDALNVFEQALQDTPRDPELLNNAAFLQATLLDDPEGALPRALAAVARMPDNWAFLDTAGKICGMLERWEDAEAFLRRSIAARPRATNTFHLAEILSATGRTRDAMRELERASELLESGEDDLRTRIDALADELAGR
ncbi:MAG: hypothetical protein ACYTEV_00205 [Planctomycetota bacterium]|jgi:tetratricopeptide (TPR) repeat protein